MNEYETGGKNEKLYFSPVFWEEQGLFGSVSLSNCPDDSKYCSIVGHKWLKGGGEEFVQIILNKEEVERMIEALQEICKDMSPMSSRAVHPAPKSGNIPEEQIRRAVSEVKNQREH